MNNLELFLTLCTCTRALHLYYLTAKNDTHAHSNESKELLMNNDTRHFS